MSKPTRSMLWCLLFVLLAEVVLRIATPGAPRSGSLAADRPLAFVLGTSRSMRGLRPAVIEKALAAEGLREPWVGNLSQKQVTTVGLYRRYRSDLGPLAAGGKGRGVLAIEVRASGMNDSYLVPDEQAWVDREVLAPLPGAPGNSQPSAPRAVGVFELMKAGRVEAAAGAFFSSFALSQTRETLRPSLERSLRRWCATEAAVVDSLESQPTVEKLAPVAVDADWARGEKGWETFPELVAPGLKRSQWEPIYRNQLLKDYHLGGIQTEFLRRIVREAKRDGFTPVLYVMPVTDIQKSFFQPGEYSMFLAHLGKFASEERVPITDLDAELALPIDAFYDTHHVNRDAVPRVSKEFARRVLLPAF